MWFIKPKTLDLQVTSRLGTFTLTVPRLSTGKDVFDRVVRALGLREFWYFGLSAMDKAEEYGWLDLRKPLLDQPIKKREPIHLRLILKYYPENVDKVILNITKRLLYLHMREAIFCEHIYCPPEMALVLASFCAQEQYGDYNCDTHQPGLILTSDFLPPSVYERYNATEMCLESIVFQLYKRRTGTTREAAISTYLNIVQDLHMYGLRHLPVITTRGTSCLCAVDSFGIRFYGNDDLLIPKTVFSLTELRGLQFTRNTVQFTVGMDARLKFVVFTNDTDLAKKLMLRVLGYRDLYIRGLSNDSNLFGYIVKGAAQSVINGLSKDSRLPEDCVVERKRLEAIMTDRLHKHDTDCKALQERLHCLESDSRMLELQVMRLQVNQHRMQQKQHETARNRSFYNFYTATSGPTIPALARDHRRIQQESDRLNMRMSRDSHIVEGHKVIMNAALKMEDQLRRQMEMDFVTLNELHVFDDGIPENEACFARELEFPLTATDEHTQPWAGLECFISTDHTIKLELAKISAELDKLAIISQQSVTDIQHRQMTDQGLDKFGIICSIMANSTQDRIRVLEKM